MQDTGLNNISIDKMLLPVFADHAIEADVLRLDKVHPLISGNKWFKLRYYMEEAKQNKKTVLSFGGAWSNHIIATAAACRLYGLGSIGIIRGEEAPELSVTLKEAKAMGMQLFFISREDYREKKLPPGISDDVYIIPE